MSSSSSTSSVDAELTLGFTRPVPFEPALPLSTPFHGLNAMNLDLNLPPPEDPLENEQWDIAKSLTESDIGSHSRLLIAKNIASEHIMQELSIEDRIKVQRTEGLQIKVLDVDRNREVFLTLKVLPSSQAHILNVQWKKEFVNRRGLVKGDVIGLTYWKQPGDQEGKLLFKVLRQNHRH